MLRDALEREEQLKRALAMMIRHAQECQSMYGISGDACIATASEIYFGARTSSASILDGEPLSATLSATPAPAESGVTDTERLDWLEHIGSLEIRCDFNNFYSLDGGGRWGLSEGLRAAIDAAIEAAKEGR